MLVVCDKCGAKFKLTVKKKPTKPINFKCGKCGEGIKLAPDQVDIDEPLAAATTVAPAPGAAPAAGTVAVTCQKCGTRFVKPANEKTTVCYQCRIDSLVSKVREKYGAEEPAPAAAEPEPEPAAAEARYTVRTADGLVLGPIKLRTVTVLAREKRIKGVEEVCKDDGDYKPLMSYPELAELFPELKEIMDTTGLEDKVDQAFMNAFQEDEEAPAEAVPEGEVPVAEAVVDESVLAEEVPVAEPVVEEVPPSEESPPALPLGEPAVEEVGPDAETEAEAAAEKDTAYIGDADYSRDRAAADDIDHEDDVIDWSTGDQIGEASGSEAESVTASAQPAQPEEPEEVLEGPEPPSPEVSAAEAAEPESVGPEAVGEETVEPSAPAPAGEIGTEFEIGEEWDGDEEEEGDEEIIEGLEPIEEPPPDARYRIRYPDGLILGPVKLGTIRELFESGNLTGQEEVQRGDDDWAVFAGLPELAELVSAANTGDEGIIDLTETMEEVN